MLDLLIIGAGPTGLYAAFMAGLRKIKAAVIESLPEAGGQLTAVYKDKFIYDIPGFHQITAGDYVKEAYRQYQRFEKEIPIYYDQEALEINKTKDHYEVVTNHKTFKTKTVLIAHGGGGFVPQKLKVGQKEYDNVLYFVADLNTYKDKEVAVLGGGDSALDWAVTLADIGARVSLIHRRHQFRALPSTVEDFVEKGRILTPYLIKDIQGDELATELMIQNIETKEEKKLSVDYVLVNYGFALTKSKLVEWGISGDRGLIFVDTTMKTNLEGIYAAGNGVTYPGKVKLISAGHGEAGTAIGAIANYLYPERSTNTEHSSSLIQEEES